MPVNSQSTNSLYLKDIISFNDLTFSEVELILQTAKKIKSGQIRCSIQDKLIANCFFEPSTRTRLSFEAAIYRMGGKVIGFPDDSSLSVRKGETLADTMRVIAGYADLIIIRHPRDGSARLTAEVANCPVINAGDGANQHPTQALIELFSIQECQSSLNGLSIALVGDLKYGRAIHSFIAACLMFDVRLYLVSPELLILPDSICDKLKKRGVRFSFHQQIEEVIPKVDILYITRIQQERFTETEYQLIQSKFILTANMLEKAKKNLKVLHPLPRVNEVALDVDKTPYAYYFQQASNGVVIRKALLALILNEELP